MVWVMQGEDSCLRRVIIRNTLQSHKWGRFIVYDPYPGAIAITQQPLIRSEELFRLAYTPEAIYAPP